MFKQDELVPMSSPSKNTVPAGSSLNYGYVNSTSHNQNLLTPVQSSSFARQSRRSFTPNFRDFGSPISSPIVSNHEKFSMGGWPGSSPSFDEHEYDGLVQKPNIQTMTRMPTFLSPAVPDAYRMSNFSPRSSNSPINGGVIPK